MSFRYLWKRKMRIFASYNVALLQQKANISSMRGLGPIRVLIQFGALSWGTLLVAPLVMLSSIFHLSRSETQEIFPKD